jgi:alkylation response protein AidB-like acyl-CoA dehydrogenase
MRTSQRSTRSGLNAMFVPEAYGGAALSYAAYLECVREISKACASTGVIWATNFHAMKPLVEFGTEEQKQRLLAGDRAKAGSPRSSSPSLRPDRTPPG